MYKVFFYGHTLYIGNALNKDVSFSEIWDYTTVKSLKKYLFEQLKNNSPQIVLITCNDPFHVWTRFCKMFQIREAAGGLVMNKEGKLLFIKRRGKWDMPKGHLDAGELHTAAAVREVSEECGIKNLKITKRLITTYHTYDIKLSPVLKPTQWFYMEYNGYSDGTPQIEEDIEHIMWVKPKEALKLFPDCFPSIIDVYKAAIK